MLTHVSTLSLPVVDLQRLFFGLVDGVALWGLVHAGTPLLVFAAGATVTPQREGSSVPACHGSASDCTLAADGFVSDQCRAGPNDVDANPSDYPAADPDHGGAAPMDSASDSQMTTPSDTDSSVGSLVVSALEVAPLFLEVLAAFPAVASLRMKDTAGHSYTLVRAACLCIGVWRALRPH